MTVYPDAKAHSQTVQAARLKRSDGQLIGRKIFTQLAQAYNTGYEAGGLDEAFHRLRMRLKELGLDSSASRERTQQT